MQSRLSAEAPAVRRRVPRTRRVEGFAATVMDRARHLGMWARERGWKRLIRDGIVAVGGLFVLYAAFLWITLPDIDDPQSLIPDHSSAIVDRNGIELYRLFQDEDREFIPSEQIPQHMKHAMVAIEDQRFYDRGCLDVRALMRAVFKFGGAGGASTLTRQLARNALDLQRENFLNRKLKELILGCQLEHRYEKDEVLAMYLNWVPFGPNAYGIELASQRYFGQSASGITLAQSAVLASMPQRPTYFNPYGSHVHTTPTEDTQRRIDDGDVTSAEDLDIEDVRVGLVGGMFGTGATAFYVGGRSDQVLQNMVDQGYITEEERAAAVEELKTMTFQMSRDDIRAAHFVLWVREQAEELLGGSESGLLNQGGLTIETTLDWELQQAAEAAVEAKREEAASVYEIHNIALVSAIPETGDIVAYVGNADYNDEEFGGKIDMARVPRQPGSSFKPLVYASAFEEAGAGPATVVFDVPTKIGGEEPQNFDGGFWGLMNARRALGASRNIPAIKMYFLAGGDGKVLDLVRRLGAPSPLEQKERALETNPDFEYGWPLALGAAETPLTEMVQAYGTIANGGKMMPLKAIKRITRNGSIIYEAPKHQPQEAIDPRIAYQITSILSDTSARPGEYWQSVLSVPGAPSAAKTGTSNKCLKRDANNNCTERRPSDLWTMGYVPGLVTGVWAGNADSSPLAAKAESLVTAAPIWKSYMTKARATLEGMPASFAVPSGIANPQISTLSGELPTECTPVAYRKSDVFLQERMPSLADPACVQLEIDKVTGLLASDECPVEARELRSFFSPTEPLAARFPHWQASTQAWLASRAGTFDPATGTQSGSVLPLPLAPTESCTLAMTPGRMEKPEITIEYPENGGGAPYPSFQPKFDISVGSRIREVRAEIDGKLAGEARGTAAQRLTVQVPKSVAEGGSHTLKITVTDEYYNTATDEVTFRFEDDKGGPRVTLLHPRNGQSLPRGVAYVMEAEAEDDEGGIKYVQFYLDDVLLSTKPQSPYTLEYDFDVEPGEYELRAVATDLADNEHEDSVDIEVVAGTTGTGATE